MSSRRWRGYISGALQSCFQSRSIIKETTEINYTSFKGVSKGDVFHHTRTSFEHPSVYQKSTSQQRADVATQLDHLVRDLVKRLIRPLRAAYICLKGTLRSKPACTLQEYVARETLGRISVSNTRTHPFHTALHREGTWLICGTGIIVFEQLPVHQGFNPNFNTVVATRSDSPQDRLHNFIVLRREGTRPICGTQHSRVHHEEVDTAFSSSSNPSAHVESDGV